MHNSGRAQNMAPTDQDIALANGYPGWPDKGPVTDGRRLTLMTEKTSGRVGEEIHVIHVAEVTEPGRQVYVMGPKQVFGEYLDGKLVTQAPPAQGDPLVPEMYDGATLPSPAADHNYEITAYSFAEPGRHEISWKLGKLHSNVIRLEISR